MSDDTAVATSNPMVNFQNKVLEKLKTDIGSMMPDDVLDGLVAKAVEEQFFKPTVIKGQYYNDRDVVKPSWFVQEVTKSAEPLLKQAVNSYIKDNEKEIKAVVDKFLQEQNLMLLASAAISNNLQYQISAGMNAVLSQMQLNNENAQ